ncbi:GTP-binding protein [Acetoanaerobium pronyense]|uniref:GTPase Obg n=1 Tax=Acetoanaerobium pronyense TaxID=1482736 RepID=A0ABS4KK03_9FIRM|nr:GTPase ObgE [Acetoanaerobium pronyense]MBP2028085.1 GTP-binding protein [Acetoanaerobium pronyense]
MFIDKAKIYVKAGNGGNGAVAFRREIYVPAGGPAGGDGGKGGNVIIVADPNLRTLMDFRYKKKYSAEPGGDGKGSNMSGKTGEDLIIKVPVGTVIKDEETDLVIVDLKTPGQTFVIAKGGRGGKGNTNFKTAVRQAPNFAKAGKDGEEKNLIFELRLLADVGLIGFPNVGKSTFLSIISKAKPKIANYHFTTITPNLGVTQLKSGDSFVVADIPGLIEGAHEGIGLGHEFLRHIERTKVLVHIVDISASEGRDPYDDFLKINSELKKYNEKLASRPQIVVANKSDILFEEEQFEDFKTRVEKDGFKVFKMSAATMYGIEDILNAISVMLKEAEDIELFEEDQMFTEEQVVIDNSNEIKVYKEKDIYIVEGRRLEKLLYSIDFEDMESIRYFQSVMEKTGVFDKLRAIGIQDGETVRIYDLEFEFYD